MLDDEKNASKSKNADYWFADASVVAELKCLTDNLMTSPQFEEQVRTRYEEWVRKGFVPRPTTARDAFDIKDLPEVCAREITNLLKKRLEPTLMKANCEIRQTKEMLGGTRSIRPTDPR